MKRLFRYLKTYQWYFIPAIGAMFLAIALDMFNPRIQKTIVDEVIIAGKPHFFKTLLLGLLAITLGRVILGYCKEYLFDYGGQKVAADLRRDLFDHIQSLSFSFFDSANTGELMARLKEDVDNIWRTIAFGAMLFTEQLIYFLVASSLMFILNWKLALVCLTMMPFIAWLAFRLENQIGNIYDKISDQAVRMNTTAQENIAGIRLVKAFGREKHEIQKFLAQNEQNYQLNIEQARILGKYYPGIELLTNVSVVLTTAVGGWLVMRDEISIGMLVAFSNYIFMLIWPMRMLGWLTNMLAQCRASLKKLEDLFQEVPAVQEPAQPIIPHKITGHLVFENAGFEYNGAPILKNIQLDVKPGQTIAIMGMTGSGKSSLINLIGRFYDCTEGNIYIDGINIKDWPLELLRRQIAVVMQDTFLFSDTIAENIKLGNPEATAAQISQAATAAKVDEFLDELPDGLETVIGERGIGLSGGQKQRISIARALIKNCPILILDDATSNLDMETEYQIQKALEEYPGVTKLIIAHRISAVKNATEIIVMDDGQIMERGTHQQLLALKQRYYETYREQFRDILDMQNEEAG
jgi:ATP-binding cassette subfamily B multidrug efflux pump